MYVDISRAKREHSKTQGREPVYKNGGGCRMHYPDHRSEFGLLVKFHIVQIAAFDQLLLMQMNQTITPDHNLCF